MAVLEIILAIILTLLGFAILAILLTRWTRHKQNEIDVSRYSSEQSAGLLDYEDSRDFSSTRSKRGRGFWHTYSTESDISYDGQEGYKGNYTPSANSLALPQSSFGDIKGLKATPELLSGTAGPITGAIGPIMQFTAPIPGATGPIKLSQKTIVQTPGPIVQYPGSSAETSEMITTGSSMGSTPHAVTGSVPQALSSNPTDLKIKSKDAPPSMPKGLPLAPIMISQRTSTRPEKPKIRQEEPITPVPIVISPVAAGPISRQPKRGGRTRAKATPLPRATSIPTNPPVPTGNLREGSKTEIRHGTRETRKTTLKQDLQLRIQADPPQNSQYSLKYQSKGTVSGPEEVYEMGQKQKTGVKIEELPEKTQSKKEKREKHGKRQGTREDMDKEKKTEKGQSKKEDGDKKEGENEEQRGNRKKEGDEDRENKEKKGDEDKEQDQDKKGNKYENKNKDMKEDEEKTEDKDMKGDEDKTEDKDLKEDEDKKEDQDKKEDEDIKEDQDKKDDEDKTEDKHIKGDEDKTEDKDIKGDEDKTEDKDMKGDEDKKESKDIKEDSIAKGNKIKRSKENKGINQKEDVRKDSKKRSL